MIRSSPRKLTVKEIECLRRFAKFEISLWRVRVCLRGVMKFNFNARANKGTRSMETKFIVPEPGILVTKQDIDNALVKRNRREISDKQLIEWATMLLMNDAYELDPKDEDLIAERLNEISFNGPRPLQLPHVSGPV